MHFHFFCFCCVDLILTHSEFVHVGQSRLLVNGPQNRDIHFIHLLNGMLAGELKCAVRWGYVTLWSHLSVTLEITDQLRSETLHLHIRVFHLPSGGSDLV